MIENVMVKEKIEETNAEKTKKGKDAFSSIVDIIQSVFDTYKEIPRFSVFGHDHPTCMGDKSRLLFSVSLWKNRKHAHISQHL